MAVTSTSTTTRTPAGPPLLLTTLMHLLLLQLLLVLPAAKAQTTTTTTSTSEICTSPTTNTFHVKVDLFAGELGYFTFEECGNQTMPTLGIEVGQTYTFVQTDPSNYYHPLGFAYFPDGDHDGKIELEPTVAGESSGTVSTAQQVTNNGTFNPCISTATCPTPLYFEGDTFLGNYSNLAQSFGLDQYEPLFSHPVPEWNTKNFSVRLNFDDLTYTQDIFYFCHVHQYMSGRIKLLKNGVPISASDDPPILYTYDAPGEFDATCGTYGLENYQLPNSQCPSQFVCGANETSNEAIEQSAKCYDAFNCAMMAGMTTRATSGSEVALFIHHMIPHHQNAVNMAKTLLKLGNLQCDDDLLDDENPDCIMTNMMRETINSQNQQIQAMRGILEALSLPEQDDCVVTVTSSTGGSGGNGTTGSSDPTSGAVSSSSRPLWLAMAMLSMVSLFGAGAVAGQH